MTRRCAARARRSRRASRRPRSRRRRARIRAALDEVGAGAGDLGLCGGASGGDLLFAEACLERGMRVELRLARAENEFLAESVTFADPDHRWERSFTRVKENPCTTVLIMPEELGPAPKGVSVHDRCNRWILYTALSQGLLKSFLHHAVEWRARRWPGRHPEHGRARAQAHRAAADHHRPRDPVTAAWRSGRSWSGCPQTTPLLWPTGAPEPPTERCDRRSSRAAVAYDAFISYSHAKDKPVATALQIGRAEARQGVVPPAGFAGVPRRHQPVGDPASVAVDRTGAQPIALSDPARLARGGGLPLGRPRNRLLARPQQRRHGADCVDRRRARLGRGDRRFSLVGGDAAADGSQKSVCGRAAMDRSPPVPRWQRPEGHRIHWAGRRFRLGDPRDPKRGSALRRSAAAASGPDPRRDRSHGAARTLACSGLAMASCGDTASRGGGPDKRSATPAR